MAAALEQRHFLESVSRLSYCNPFAPERLALERAALGEEYRENEQHWNVYVGSSGELTNILTICHRLEPLLATLRSAELHEQDEELYDDLVVFALYHRYRGRLSAIVESGSSQSVAALFRDFSEDVKHYYGPTKTLTRAEHRAECLFAMAFQISRAFYYIYRFLIGSSAPMIELRARVWESIFSADLRRYRRSLIGKMHEFPTLVTGSSGTGKELVARAIGLSQYIPFDPRQHRFVEEFQLKFQALNLSALSPTLIESELFGHKRGSFTGAISDRVGWLAAAGRYGTVFLDEIGELDLGIQVKLLRVVESRSFQRLGDTKPLQFEGKLVTATNRTLPRELEAGKFRSDLFFRLVGDQITTPTLRSRLDAAPEELHLLTRHLAGRILPQEESERFAALAVRWIEQNLPRNYGWPGNVRELEQCLRNILVHNSYLPLDTPVPQVTTDGLYQKMERAELSAQEVTDLYIERVYRKCLNYEETGRKLGLDRRTVKARLTRSPIS